MMGKLGIRNGELGVRSWKTFIACSTLVALLALLSSCDVHQFPDEKEPDLPVETVKVPLHLVFDTDFYVWEHKYDPVTGKIVEEHPDANEFANHPGATSKYDNTITEGVMDIFVKAYLDETKGSRSDVPVLEKEFTFILGNDTYDRDLEIDLPVGQNYKLAVWGHLRHHENAGHFYDASNFNKVSIIGSNYSGNTDYRDGFAGKINLDTYEVSSDAYTVNMRRPMGKYEFITLDLSEFLDRETSRRSKTTRASADEYNVIISFTYYYPSSYSLLDDRLENSVAGVNFQTKMTVTGTSEASLGFEYVMLNNIKDAAVQTKVDVYDPSYTHVAGSTTLTIPMGRDVHTVLRGYFLSEEGEGGIGIDPDFDGEFNLTM